MDIEALQTRLRDFAAARDWQPFHSPKNLAMALMVEAAELLELFQWLTPEQSRMLPRKDADKERVGDEIADVLLYLLQLADHTGVDVEEAVERKLGKNAEKHPATHPKKAAPVPKGHLLIDWENVQPRGEELRRLAPEGTDVWLFHGPRQKVDVSSHLQVYGADRVTLIPRPDVVKKNALDFQLSYYIGYISARQPQELFIVVSNDTGYDPMLAHARELGFDAKRCEIRRPPTLVKPKPSPAVPPALPALAPVPAAPVPSSSAASDTALVNQVAESAFSNLRFIPIANRPRQEEPVLAYFRLFIPKDVKDTGLLARRAWTLLLDRGDLLAPESVPTDPFEPASTPSIATAKKDKVNTTGPVVQAVPPPLDQSKAPPKALAQPASAKATRQDVQRIVKSLQTMPSAQRPVRKDTLLEWLQVLLGDIGTVSPRVAHALAQLQAQKRVALKGDGVSYPSDPATPATLPATAAEKKQATPVKKVPTPAKAAAVKLAPKPTAAQIGQAVLVSLKKMPKNKPMRRAGLLKFIETHATKVADPKTMAQQVCALLEVRKDVVLSPDGKGVIYPKLT